MKAEKPPVYFGMPLRSAVTTKNWPRVSRLLRDCIVSVAAQTDPDIRILVACHERPDLDGFDDSRLEFLAADNPRPDDVPSQMHDKGAKIRRVAEEICRRGGGYFVLMDADDLVSNRLAAHIRTDDNRRGYLMETGYILNVARRQFAPAAPFWQHCGTCAVFHLTPDDLNAGPDGLIARLTPKRMSHHAYPGASAACGRELAPLPFPSAVYIRHHGENRSVQRRPGWKLTDLRNAFFRVATALIPPRPIAADICTEFSIPDDVVSRFGGRA